MCLHIHTKHSVTLIRKSSTGGPRVQGYGWLNDTLEIETRAFVHHSTPLQYCVSSTELSISFIVQAQCHFSSVPGRCLESVDKYVHTAPISFPAFPKIVITVARRNEHWVGCGVQIHFFYECISFVPNAVGWCDLMIRPRIAFKDKMYFSYWNVKLLLCYYSQHFNPVLC